MQYELLMELLDARVSLYKGVKDNVGTEVSLWDFLSDHSYRPHVDRLRSTSDPDERAELKRQLPLVTVSGLFKPTRKADHLVSHSGLICLDIDGKDNPCIEVSEIRSVLSERSDVAYASLSAGGGGMYAIIPIAYPHRHLAQFLALEDEFRQSYGICLDRACKDVTRLRAASYDPQAYINPNAKPYTGINLEQERRPRSEEDRMRFTLTPEQQGTQYEAVVRCVEKIEQYGIDITGGYSEWFRIGMSLASLGDAKGRPLFHAVSRQYKGYTYEETDRKFNDLLRSRGDVGLGTFFYWCQQYGITYMDNK